MQKFILLLLVSTMLNSCSNLAFNTEQNQTTQSQINPQSTNKPQYMHFYVEQLTRQLLATANNIDLKKSIAVGTILPSQP